MPSLMDLLNDDTGAQSVKTASDNDIERMAAELGLSFGGGVKTAAEMPDAKGGQENGKGSKEEESEEEAGEKGQHKKASLVGIDGLYDSLFPGDALGGVKTAAEQELTKEAAEEQALGARSFDYYAHRFDQRIEKLAYGVLAHGTVANHDSEHPNHMENDHGTKGNHGKAIDTKPEYDNEIIPEQSDAVVGHEEWATGHNTIDNPKGVHGGHSKKAALARRKHQLLSALER